MGLVAEGHNVGVVVATSVVVALLLHLVIIVVLRFEDIELGAVVDSTGHVDCTDCRS